MKKLWLEVIGVIFAAPVLIWCITFISNTYKIEAHVADLTQEFAETKSSQKQDIKEIKEDVKYIRNYLLEKK